MRLLLTSIFLLLASIAWATDYQVPAGTDLNLILKFAVPGDNFTLQDGTFPGGIWVSEKSGTALHPITLKAANVGKAIITGSTATRTSTFSLYKSSWWRVTGIVFEKGENAGLWFGSSSNNNYFSQCEVRNCGVQGMLTGTSNNGTVEDCSFHDITGPLGQHCAYISQTASGWMFRRVKFYNANRAGLQCASQGAGGVISNIRVEDCSFWQCGLANQAAAFNGLGITNSVFTGCVMSNCLTGGFVFSPNGSVGGDSVNNLVSNCTVIFQPGQGRACVQQTGGTLSLTGCRLWAGKPQVDAITALSGAVILQGTNVVLAPMPLTVPIVGGGTGGTNN